MWYVAHFFRDFCEKIKPSFSLPNPCNTCDTWHNYFRVFSETMSRSEASVSPFILRSAAAVCSSASELTETLPTNNRPSPLPFVATRRVSSAPPHRAREIGDRRPLQDWSIGPCCCPFLAERLSICPPRALNSGQNAEIQIRSDGCPVGEKAS